jgi:pyridoxal phosphate enzyme (YggS family)
MPEAREKPAATVAARLAEVKARIARAAEAAGRAGGEVTLVAVSKLIAADAIVEALEAGHRHFGENRVQEARAKWPELKLAYPDTVLHLIGPLQTNKVRDAVELFDVIETVDRPRLAGRLALECGRQRRSPVLFIEVNTGEEAQKSGVAPGDVARFVAEVRAQAGLDVRGLMCIPPLDEEASLHFALLARIAREVGLGELSMGMSHDFETAVAFGATEVRVGTAIFGPRPSPAP